MRISFTGELCYEINVSSSYAHSLWAKCFELGKEYQITPYGTEAMHVLRAEKGFIIVGQETDGSVTPSKISNSGDFLFPADVRLKDSDGSHYVGFQAPTTVSTNKVWTLPAADGSASQYLQTNGSGVLSWASVTIGGGSGIDFNDNVKARWGTGNDLEIFHNASNSVINDAGTGDLLLQVGGTTQATISST